MPLVLSYHCLRKAEFDRQSFQIAINFNPNPSTPYSSRVPTFLPKKQIGPRQQIPYSYAQMALNLTLL